MKQFSRERQEILKELTIKLQKRLPYTDSFVNSSVNKGEIAA